MDRQEMVNSEPEKNKQQSPFGDEITLFNKELTLDIDKQIEIRKLQYTGFKRILPIALAVLLILYNLLNIAILHDNQIFLALISIGPCFVLIYMGYRGYYVLGLLSGARKQHKVGYLPEYVIGFKEDAILNYSVHTGKVYRHILSEFKRVKELETIYVFEFHDSVVAAPKDDQVAAYVAQYVS